MKNKSIWLDNIKYRASKKLNVDKIVDVLIIGGGITGMNVAYKLKNSNLNVCLVEKNKIGHGVTSRSTAKITYLQELIYTKLKKYHSESISKLYLDSQLNAIKELKEIIEHNNIDCNLEKVKSYVYTNEKKEINKIYEEYKLIKSFGVEVNECSHLPNNKKFLKGIYVNDTFTFHPIKYLIGLKKVIENDIDIYENTKIIDIRKENDKYVCNTGESIITTKYVVVATHYPYFLKPFFFPLKGYLEKSYIVASTVKKDYDFSAITSVKPTESIRFYKI